MYPLFRKEISHFFSSLTGYLVIGAFLLANSLFLWIFPGEYNLADSGYASLDPLFILAPWVFLFLVPAVTMRMIADERRAGTLELLLSRPLSEMHIVLSKYFAALTLVLLSLLPTLVYYVSVVMLGDPPGNIDAGGTLGSLAGLFFLASIYAAMGILASSLTDNQVIAFLLAVALSLFFYAGFDALGTLAGFGPLNEFIPRLGINEHYRSMSRGVIDSRDMIYFICVNALLLLFTRLKLQSRRW